MEKNYNFNYEHKKVISRPRIDIDHLEVVSCKKSVLVGELKKLTDGLAYHTTDTNEFFYDWNGKRYQLDIFKSATETQDAVSKKELADAIAKINKSTSSISSELTSKINSKADKSSVDAALAKKADKTEITSLVNKTVDDAMSKNINDTVNTAISKIVGDAPETFDTLKEIADWIEQNQEAIESVEKIEDIENSLSEISSDVEELGNALAGEISAREELAVTVDTKADSSVVEELATVLNTKADASDVDVLKTEVEDLVAIIDTKADIDTLDELAGKVNSLEGVVAGKADASDVEELTSVVEELNEIVEKLSGDGEGSVSSIVAEEVAAIVAGADSDFDTLKEIADWIEADKTRAAELTATVSGKADKSEIPSLDGYATESWVEDKGYLTEHQSLDGYAKLTDIPEGIITSIKVTTKSGYPEQTVSVKDGEASIKMGQLTFAVNGDRLRSFAPALGVNADGSPVHSDDNMSYSSFAINFVGSDNISVGIDAVTSATSKMPTLKIDTTADVALKSDIPSLDGYAKTTDIPSLDGYAKTTDIPSLDGYAKITDIPSLDGYAKTTDISTEIEKLVGSFATESEEMVEGYAKVSDIIAYVAAEIEKKKDELAPVVDEKDYIYISGYALGETPTYITHMNQFELSSEESTEIEFRCESEAVGYDDVLATLLTYDIPSGYSANVYLYNPQAKVYNTTPTEFIANPAGSTKKYGSKTYSSYVRKPEDGLINSDMVTTGTVQYKIIVTKD